MFVLNRRGIMERMQRGFGLVELLLVVAILGILAGLILSASSRGRLKAYDTAIENAVRQIRWQAEIASTSNGESYLNWADETSIIQEELTILLDEIDKSYGDTAPGYVTQIRQEQITDYCVSAPSRAEPGKYYCVDAGGEIRLTDAACPEDPDPLRCL